MIKVGIVGAAGYTGGEMLRILLRHPQAHIQYALSSSNHGNPVYQVHQDLVGETDLVFAKEMNADVDVVFLCMGHGDSVKFLQQHTFAATTKIIDLSQDFRLKVNAVLGDRTFVYGLPELNKASIIEAQNIANPGCFATALQLGLLPLYQHGYAGSVFTTGITGATGAGQKLAESSHFAWRANNIQAYKSLSHQHLLEVNESLQQVGNITNKAAINFIPWRGDFPRGIFISSQVTTDLSLETLYDLYETFYANQPFTTVVRTPIHMKQVVNTNKCLIQIEQHEGQTVIHSCIDNLLKGASGQAVQNMNLMFGLDEKMGIDLKANYF